jgi:glycosyltransferase involved in cell wall biosynthesis
MTNPLISIILPCYNSEKFVSEAVESILTQTFTDFELIVINDGSTDDSLKAIRQFKDERIKLISHENKGLVASLNEGIAMANATLIARQDADDISEPTRLEKQYDRFLKDRRLVILGTSIKTINMSGKVQNTHTLIAGQSAVKPELLIRSPFAHGSVMFRRDIFKKAGGYTKVEWPAEDYGAWIRIAKYGTMDNLIEPLYRYRENEFGISALNNNKQISKTALVKSSAWKHAIRFIGWPHTISSTGKADVNTRIANNYTKILIQAVKRLNILVTLSITISILISPMLIRKIAGKIRRAL